MTAPADFRPLLTFSVRNETSGLFTKADFAIKEETGKYHALRDRTPSLTNCSKITRDHILLRSCDA